LFLGVFAEGGGRARGVLHNEKCGATFKCVFKKLSNDDVKITDEQLRQHFDRVLLVMKDSYPAEERPVVALLDAWQWFRLTEGADSPRVAECIGHLLAPELRPALRRWYQRFGSDMNPAAIEFRDRLSELAGERFG